MSEVDQFVLRLGYTCACGQQVTVFRLPTPAVGRVQLAPRAVTCRNGHARWVTLEQLATLDHWVEQVEDEEELETGT